jgi:hypothetical protein
MTTFKPRDDAHRNPGLRRRANAAVCAPHGRGFTHRYQLDANLLGFLKS